MPNTFSNDIDFVPHPPKKPAPKREPPLPWVMPEFTPHKVTLCDGKPNLPDDVNASDPLAIFDLFFSEEIIDKLV